MSKFHLLFNISLIFLREKNRFVAYSPAIDLSTSGKTFEEAKKRFNEAAVLFFEELARRKILNEALEELGWQKVRSEWRPPAIVSQHAETIHVPVHARV